MADEEKTKDNEEKGEKTKNRRRRKMKQKIIDCSKRLKR